MGDTKPHLQRKNNSDHRHSISTSNDGVATSMPVRNTSGMPEQNEHRDNVHWCTDPTRNHIRVAPLPSRNVSGQIPCFMFMCQHPGQLNWKIHDITNIISFISWPWNGYL